MKLDNTKNKIYEDWINRKWRPLMGYTYMVTCVCDFIIFPILWSILQSVQNGQITSQWNPITLQGGGLFHLSMGTIIGVAAWSRGKEKIAGVSSGMTPFSTMQSFQQESSYEEQRPTEIKKTIGKRPIETEPPEL